jgi:hypothetical protein
MDTTGLKQNICRVKYAFIAGIFRSQIIFELDDSALMPASLHKSLLVEIVGNLARPQTLS